MRFLFCKTARPVIQFLLAICVVAFASETQAKDKRCSLENAKAEESGTTWNFKIELLCDPNGRDDHLIPVGSRIFVGLTLYPLANVDEVNGNYSTLDNLIASSGAGKHDIDSDGDTIVLDQKQPIDGIKRHALEDFNFAHAQESAPLDIDAQEIVVLGDKDKYELVFTTASEKVKEHDAFLFAAWREEDKSTCQADEFSRPGCKEFGYVFGDDGGVYPLDVYPGIIFISNFRVDETTRWIVQRFR